MRAQAATEYLIVMIAMLAIVGMVAALLLNSSGSISSIEPQTCSFDTGIACKGLVVASNSTSTLVALMGSNAKRYEMRDLSVAVKIGNAVSSLRCTPDLIKPGAPFMCFGSLSRQLSAGTQVAPAFVANVSYCGLDSCNNQIKESFIGSANTYVSKYKVPNFGITLSSPVYAPAGAVTLSVDLDVLGHNFTIERADIEDGNVSTSAYSPYAYFVNISHSSSNNLDTVNVSFAGSSSNETFVLNMKTINNMYCSQNSTNLVLELLLTGYYSQFIKYPSGFDAFTCPLYNNSVYCVSNSSAYFASLPNAETGEWISTNSINTQNRIFACLAYDSILYCFTNSSAYYSAISQNGLSAWNSLTYPLFVNLTSCS